jgi:hypothetical protein
MEYGVLGRHTEVPVRLQNRSLAILALLVLAAGCGSTDDSSTPQGGDAGPDVTAPPSAQDASLDAPALTPDAEGTVDAKPSDDAPSQSDSGPPPPPAKQSLIWVWMGYADALSKIEANKGSFTHVSPALYNINYDYQSGVAHLVNGNDNFDGLSSKEFSQRVHAAGLKCVPLMYAGAGNFGTDQGIQNILNDAPPGTQKSFITSMVSEAQAKGYDGYNLDWEVSQTGYAKYGAKLVTFLAAFKSALNAHNMVVSLDLGGWYVRQCDGSGGDGLVDLVALGNSVDQAIFEAYSGSLGSPGPSCPASNPNHQDCDADFVAALSVMCNLPRDVVSIGLISTGTNPFADKALSAAAAYGFSNVAVWPDDSKFLNASGMPNGATWYSVLADFLGH